ncbi:hypothetical protein WMY93_021045 [Mugilogobius chulae]|uniref:SKICH domain-containing protein n=1 Tax=Mugilogobius chulae TaxID=88201 RepID=A0AAW0NCQ8_9GOBI
MSYCISDHKPVSSLFSLQFPFKVDMPLVELHVNKEWTKVSDAVVRVTVASSYQRSSWDWVAIYKVGFRHYKDYQAYVWAKLEHTAQIVFPEEELPKDDLPIQIKLPNDSPHKSDSSDISSEDDSTLELLAPNSRSPSPKTGRHHQRHRRSRSPAVPALTSNPLPSLQGLSLSPLPKDNHTHSRSACSAAKKERLVSPDLIPSPAVSPLSPHSPVSPGSRVSAPEALVAAILGDNRHTAGFKPNT